MMDMTKKLRDTVCPYSTTTLTAEFPRGYSFCVHNYLSDMHDAPHFNTLTNHVSFRLLQTDLNKEKWEGLIPGMHN